MPRYRLGPKLRRARVATVYKICSRAQWQAAQGDGEFRGSPVDARDGFIHLSTAAQLPETAAKHFAQQTDLVVVAVDAEALGGRLRFEPSRGGALFPHLYMAVPLSAVRWVRPLPDEVDGRRPVVELQP
jgi:uncharacterized protein (DUF952 family)